MNNTAGMSQAEMQVLLMGLIPARPNRHQRRVMSRAVHGDDNKPLMRRSERRKKNRTARRARARNRTR